MKKWGKDFLGVFLAIAIVAGMLPSAFAFTEESYSEQQMMPSAHKGISAQGEPLSNIEVYQISNDTDFNHAIANISNSASNEFEIILQNDLSGVSFAGVSGKHIIVKSEGENQYKIPLDSELKGPITFDNVYATAGVLFCNGQRTIFTSNSKLVTTGTIYGGGNKKTVDSTYLVVNGEAAICNATYDYENIVIGGSYKGSVKGDIYIELAGEISFGNNRTGGHYITGANKETSYGGDRYTGEPLYVGGDVTLIIDTDHALSPNSHNVSGTHSSHVYGDVNIVVKAGKTHGINAQRGDASKSRIDGNVHIVAGAKEYENTDRIYRIVANWDITGAGESIMTVAPEFEVGGNVTIDAFENVWGWDKGAMPPSDLPGIVGAKNAKVDGAVTINVHGSHLESVFGAEDESVGTSHGVISFSTVVKKDIIINATDIDLQCAEDSDANIVGCYIENGTVGGAIEVNVDGGSMYGIWADGEYISPGKVTINITGEPEFRYGIWGEKDRTEPEDSVINIYACKGTIPFLYYATQVNIYDASNVTIGGQYKPFYNVGDLNLSGNSILHTVNKNTQLNGDVTMDGGTWHAEGNVYVYETMKSQNSYIYFDNYFAIGYNYRDDLDPALRTVYISSKDEFVALKSGYYGRFYGNVDLDKSDLAFMCPVTVSGNWTGGDSLLRLPVVSENYPAGTIPLEINGVASEQCKVLTVAANDKNANAMPNVGQNYIVGFAPDGTRTNNPVQATFVLANTDAVENGLYLKRVKDPKNESENYMWQVATGVSIIPADVTIYMGGDGYKGAVDTDGTSIASGNGFPEPGFVVALPEDVAAVHDEEGKVTNIRLVYIEDGKNEPTSVWGLEKYGDGNHNIYKIKPSGQTASTNIRMIFTDMDGNAVDSDSFEFNSALYQKLKMKVYDENVIESNVKLVYTASDGIETEYDIMAGTGTLTVRGASDAKDEEQYGAVGNTETAIKAGTAGVVADQDISYTINGSPVKVDRKHEIALLFDEILEDNNVADITNTELLTEKADEVLEAMGDSNLSGEGEKQYQARYLDLVDRDNGNAWVAADKPITVYWPLPEGTTKDTKFELLHFPGLHREMGTSTIAEKIDACNVERIRIMNVTDTHIAFEVKPYSQDGAGNITGGFSPFVLTWEKVDDTSTPGGGGTTYYMLEYVSNGGTEYENERYVSGTTAKLTKVPTREGYTFTGWYADEALTEKITSIKMTENKTVYAGWKITGVPEWLNGDDHYAYVIGYADQTVKPLADITRAEVATIFFRLLTDEVRDGNLTTVSPFTDVKTGDWYNTAIATMAKLGVLKGRTETTFEPDEPITRAEFAAICARFDTGLTEGGSNFKDIAGHWAEKEIGRAVMLGWINGYEDDTFRPENDITRAEAVTMINRVLQRLPESEGDLLDDMIAWPDNKSGMWYYLAMQEATNSHDFDRKGDGVHEKWTALTEDPDWSQYQ